MPFSAERQKRVCHALQQNLDIWLSQLEEIEAHANPGNKARTLFLMRNMMQAKAAIGRIMAEDGEDACTS